MRQKLTVLIPCKNERLNIRPCLESVRPIADEILIVAAPDLANLRNAKNLVDLLRQQRTNDVPARLIINKNGLTKRPEIKVEDFAAALNLTPLAVIPFDAALFGTAANNGQMIAETDPKSPIAAAFDLIGRTVTGRAEVKRQKQSLFGSLFKKRAKKAT